jgi:general secretion pathway protein D
MGVDVRHRCRRFTLAFLLLYATPFVVRDAAAQDTTGVRATAGGILVDFQDVDLRAVITALAEAGGLNVSYGDLPARRVTLRLHSPITQADVLPLLRSIAQSNGLQVIQEDKFIRLQADNAGGGGGVAPGAQPGARRTADFRLYVYPLKHVRAPKLASTLQAIFGARGTGPVGNDGLSTRSLSQQLTNNQLPAQGPGADSARAAAARATPGTGIAGTLQGEVQIVPDETTNSLVIHAQPADYDIVRQAIEALDLRPLQVLIEVLIAEVRHTSELDLGISAQSKREGPGTASWSNAVVSSNSTADLIIRLSRDARFDINIAVHALQSRGDVRILSRPVLLAQNNQEAKILVGSQRPFVQVFRSLPTDAAVRDQVVQYKDVGTSLTILPTINADGYVNLQVAQEVSSATNETQFDAPVISTREASTHLFVRDGQTAVLGGLIDREQDRNRSGLPILSSLPGIGALFGSTTDNRTDTELFLFLTPHIVYTDADADRLREQIDQAAPAMREQLPKNPPIGSAKPPENRPPSR